MFIKPQIASTPHLVAPMGDVIGQACQSGFGTACPSGFSCKPYQGSDCIDATYFDPYTGAAVGLVIGVAGGIIIAK